MLKFLDILCLLGIALIAGLFLFVWVTKKVNSPERLKARRNIPGLIKYLSITDIPLLTAYIKALGEVGDARAIMPLIEKQKDPNKEVRQAVTQSMDQLAKRGENQELKADPQLISEIPALLPLLHSPDWLLARLGAAGLENCAWQPQGTEASLYHALRKNWPVCIQTGEEAVEALEFSLEHWYPPRDEVVETIARINGTRSAAFLTKILLAGPGDSSDQHLLFETVKTVLKKYAPVLAEPLLRQYDNPAHAASGAPLPLLLLLVSAELDHPGSIQPTIQALASGGKSYYSISAAAFSPNLAKDIITRLRSSQADVRLQALEELLPAVPFPFGVYEAAIFSDLLYDPDHTEYTHNRPGDDLHGGDGRETAPTTWVVRTFPLRTLTITLLKKQIPHMPFSLGEVMAEEIKQAYDWSETMI